MAKLSRKQRQKLKQKQQNKLIKSGVKPQEISQLSNKELEQRYTSIVTKETKQNQRKQTLRKQAKARAEKLDFKRNSLEALGFESKYATRVKYKDIEAYKRGEENALNREKYPFLFHDKCFDFDKEYNLPDGKRLFIAYRDQQGELDFEELLYKYQDYTPEQLLDKLEYIVNLPREHTGAGSGSSGRAGEYKFEIASELEIKLFNSKAYNDTKRDRKMKEKQDKGQDALYVYHTPKTKKERLRKRRQFKGEKVGFQVLKNESGRVSYDTVTPRNLLIVANAIMYNVTEPARENFYDRFYSDMNKYIPEFGKILPKN